MLAQLEERRLQTTRALTLYLEIPPDHTRGEPAQTAIVRCYETILARLRAEKSSRAAAWEQQAIERISQIVATFREPADWNPAQAQIALRLARLQLDRQPRAYVEADGLLEQVMQSHAAQSSATEGEVLAQWRGIFQQAVQLRIVSLAGQGRYSQARVLVDQLSQTDTGDLLRVLDGLFELSAHSSPDSRRALGELQLWATEELRNRRSELDDAQLERLDRCLAEAYTATGMTERAIETYEQLVARSPADRKVLETVAGLLFECGTPECLERSKTHWRKLESLRKPGDPDWLAARYEVARCCFELGQFDECRKLVIAAQVLYPSLGGEQLKAQFEALRLRLDQQTRR
jgi:tetratricopeptide (TPR) repeat protein